MLLLSCKKSVNGRGDENLMAARALDRDRDTCESKIASLTLACSKPILIILRSLPMSTCSARLLRHSTM